jgi:hypothetical protein
MINYIRYKAYMWIHAANTKTIMLGLPTTDRTLATLDSLWKLMGPKYRARIRDEMRLL